MTRRKPDPRAFPATVTVAFALMVLSSLRVSYGGNPFDLKTFAELPVLNGGRVKPLESVARNSLLVLSGKQAVRGPNGRSSAIEWFLDMAFYPNKADGLAIIEINDPDVLGMMGIEQSTKRRFTYNELRPHFKAIEEQAARIENIKAEQRGRFEAAALNLYNRLILYQKLQNTLEAAGTEHSVHELEALERRIPELMKRHAGNPKADPDLMREVTFFLSKFQFMSRAAEFFPLSSAGPEGAGWASPGQAGMMRLSGGALHPALRPLAEMADAYRTANVPAFNEALRRFSEISAAMSPAGSARARRETLFNHAQPFYRALLIYLAAFLGAALSWMVWRERLQRTATWLVVLAFAVHTVGLVSRMVLQGRPPVTNLYSSAIFVGWAAVLLGIVVERFFRNGLATVAASLIGFSTLIIAHHLASQGDTLEMMRAVLDSNFWLATHVVTITIGYSSTFLSGFLAIVYLARRAFMPAADRAPLASVERMVYGVVCFSTFFSFVGTILGGIWADQSWGRFWGWDPKENGALMIVMWNAFVLHARWGRAVEEPALMALVVFGNVVTAMSWFGVNMLGIGLHSYGFMDKAFVWLVIFSVSQLLIMALAALPAGAFRRGNGR